MRPRTGFTLLEVMLSVSVGAVVLSALTMLMYVYLNQQLPVSPSYTSAHGTFVYYGVPSSRAFNQATRLIDEFQSQIADATAVFTLGGFREEAGSSPTTGDRAPLLNGYSFPAAGGSGAGQLIIPVTNIPQSAADFRAIVSSRTGVQFEGGWGASDFSVVTMSGLTTVSSVTQVRRYEGASGGLNFAFYEVVFDRNLADPRDATEGTATQNRFSYRISLPIAEDGSWVMPVGALHYWFRSDTTWSRREEGPTRLIFPDPMLLAGDQPAGDTRPFSRFKFFLKTTN